MRGPEHCAIALALMFLFISIIPSGHGQIPDLDINPSGINIDLERGKWTSGHFRLTNMGNNSINGTLIAPNYNCGKECPYIFLTGFTRINLTSDDFVNIVFRILSHEENELSSFSFPIFFFNETDWVPELDDYIEGPVILLEIHIDLYEEEAIPYETIIIIMGVILAITLFKLFLDSRKRKHPEP